ncbi:MAG: C4-dicarboxylate ABC transporter substrate-binding protein [Alcaligenaceae bacterium]|nr:MAG: C4-dicarboxylate ABC transporter substrate-binding protein [Alcaligenaceae bacterium]
MTIIIQGLVLTPCRAADMVVTSEIPLIVNPSPYITEFVEAVTKRTNGALNGKYFHAASLYNDRDAIAALGTGAVQIVFPVTSRLEQMDARVGVASLPFSLSSTKMLNKCFADGYTKLLSSFVEPKGAKILGILRTADLMFLMKSRDVQKLEDLKGQKIRVISGGIILDTIKSVGASPVALAAPELSPAISQGVIDGMITSPAGWADVVGITAKYATLVPGMSLATSAVLVDKKWFDGLPVAQRQTIQEVIDEIIKRQWIETVAKDEMLIKRMIDLGGSYRVMAPAEVERLKGKFLDAGANFRKQHDSTIKNAEQLEKSCGLS